MKHRRLPFLVFTLLISQSVFTQNTTSWFADGAQWAYSYESLGGPGSDFYWEDGDTMINGYLCTRVRNLNAPDFPFSNGGSELYFAYTRNDSVFYKRASSGDFKLLYDFTRMPGDTLHHLPNGLYAYGVVTGVGQADWQGSIPLRYQDIRLVNPDWDSSYQVYNTRVWERVGGQDHLFYWDVQSPITEIQYTLYCYRDDAYPLANNCLPESGSPYYGLPIGFLNSGHTATWSEEKQIWCNFTGYQYYTSGDSVIWGVGQGKKLYYRSVYEGMHPCPDGSLTIETGPWQLVGLLDQQSKHVYFTRLSDNWEVFPYNLDDTFPSLETYKILYDFDLEPGQVLHWKPASNIVAFVDSVQVEGGSWRQRYFFSDAAGVVDTNYFWLEGVGGSYGLFTPYLNPATDISQQLKCLRGNGNLLYRTVDAVFCDSVVVSEIDIFAPEPDIRLYPNPAGDHFFLEIPVDLLPSEIRLYDMLGRLVEIRMAEAAQQRFDTRNYAENGIFTVSVSMKDRLVIKRMLFSKKHVH